MLFHENFSFRVLTMWCTSLFIFTTNIKYVASNKSDDFRISTITPNSFSYAQFASSTEVIVATTTSSAVSTVSPSEVSISTTKLSSATPTAAYPYITFPTSILLEEAGSTTAPSVTTKANSPAVTFSSISTFVPILTPSQKAETQETNEKSILLPGIFGVMAAVAIVASVIHIITQRTKISESFPANTRNKKGENNAPSSENTKRSNKSPANTRKKKSEKNTLLSEKIKRNSKSPGHRRNNKEIQSSQLLSKNPKFLKEESSSSTSSPLEPDRLDSTETPLPDKESDTSSIMKEYKQDTAEVDNTSHHEEPSILIMMEDYDHNRQVAGSSTSISRQARQDGDDSRSGKDGYAGTDIYTFFLSGGGLQTSMHRIREEDEEEEERDIESLQQTRKSESSVVSTRREDTSA